MGLCSSNSYDETQALPQVKPSNNKLKVILQPLSSNKLYSQRLAPPSFYAKNQLMGNTVQLSELPSHLELVADSDKNLLEKDMELSRKTSKDWESRKTHATVSTISESDKEDLGLSAQSQESIFQ